MAVNLAINYSITKLPDYSICRYSLSAIITIHSSGRYVIEPKNSRRADPHAIDRAVATLAQRWPGLEIRGAEPSPDGRSLLLDGQAQAWLVRDRANVVGFDLRSGELIDWRDGRDMSVHQRISEMADPLHFGSFGGWPVRLIWFLFGAAMTTLCFTGVYLYGLRVSDALKSALRRSKR